MKKTILGIGALILAAAGAAYATLGDSLFSSDASGDPQLATSASAAEIDVTSGLSEEELAALTPEDRGMLYIIYDSSNSMWGELEDQSRKYEAGRRALGALLASPLERDRLAFRAYGHRRAGDCADLQLIVPPSSPDEASPQILEAVENMRPTGMTPITDSLRAALNDFGDDNGDILLISDGIETCEIDPCALMEQWRDEGVKIRVHVVGIGLNDMERTAMACVADTSGGAYFDAGSEAELVEALNTASQIAPGSGEEIEESQDYLLEIRGTDTQGRSYPLAGELLSGGNAVQELTSIGHNSVEAAGDYTISAGVLLKDGSIYQPVTAPVTLDQRGEVVVVELEVAAPARVSARFSENAEEHRGANVEAWQNGAKTFEFRPFDEALARPGSYEFRSDPNQDNQLTVDETLSAGVHTVVDFDLVETVTFTIQFRQPDGEIVRRNSTLSRGGSVIYSVHAHNGGRAIPGTYQLQMNDPRMPLPQPVDVTISTEGQDIIVDLPAGFLTISYVGDEDDFLRVPSRAFVARINSDGSIGRRNFTPIDQAVSFTPGRYRVLGHDNVGYFEPVDIMLRSGQELDVELRAIPLGQVVLTYDPSATTRQEPTRAFLDPLDGQELVGCNCDVGSPMNVPPGRYRVRGWSRAGNFARQEITVRAGQTTRVTITN